MSRDASECTLRAGTADSACRSPGRRVFVAGAAASLAWPGLVRAQGLRKPIKLVCAYATGGSIDLAARRIADDLAADLGQPVVIENRVGANGVTAADYVAKSAPDGTTILFTTLPAHAGNKSAYKKLPYDTIADFVPVTVMAVVPLVLVAHPSVPASNVAELVKVARERPGKLNYASFGVGGIAHLAAVQLNLIGRTTMNHVPYKGGGPALVDVAGGHVDFYFSGVATALPLIRDGKIKALAVSSLTRLKSLPNVPAVAETPGFENFEAVVSPVMLAPAKTPPDVVARLHAATLKAVNTDAHRAKLDAAGEGEARATSPEQSLVMLRREVERLAELFKAAGIEPE